MEPRLLMWGLFTFIVVPGSVTEFCENDPPEISHATFKALAYVKGTMLNCECKRGFRRIQNGSPYMLCRGNSSWENKCQCVNPWNPGKEVTAHPEEQKEGRTTEMQSRMQPEHQESLPGHCREPPPWEHEDTQRIYHFMVGQTLHYQCIPGYKALQRGPFTSICQMICGETMWTQPQLTCLNESQHHQLPGEYGIDATQSSTAALPGSEASCAPTTTDFQQHSEVATTMETLIFTMEYQVAVAGCVFLLISILLLSGLTWQRRRKKSRRTI